MATDTSAGPVERVPGGSGEADSGAVGFALPDVLGIDAGRVLELMEHVVDAGFEPVMSTEVCGVSAPSLAAALAARRPGVQLGTAIVPLGARSEAALAMDAARPWRRSPGLRSSSASARRRARSWRTGMAGRTIPGWRRRCTG